MPWTDTIYLILNLLSMQSTIRVSFFLRPNLLLLISTDFCPILQPGKSHVLWLTFVRNYPREFWQRSSKNTSSIHHDSNSMIQPFHLVDGNPLLNFRYVSFPLLIIPLGSLFIFSIAPSSSYSDLVPSSTEFLLTNTHTHTQLFFFLLSLPSLVPFAHNLSLIWFHLSPYSSASIFPLPFPQLSQFALLFS